VPPLPGELTDETEATVVAARGRDATVVTRGDATRVSATVRPREPRVAPPRQEAVQRRPRPPAPSPGDRPPHDNARLLALLAGIVAVVVIAAVIIISLGGGGGGKGSVSLPFKHYSTNAQTAVGQMQQTVDANQQ
jgi:hypothetical protein